MSRPVDMGLAERWAWVHYEQTPAQPLSTCPFTLEEIVSYAVLGALTVAVLMVW